ncbi:MAG TPA: glycosyltransferase [Candidatus Elarobacter sp.]|jgi:glycosyltransferase involved in cell wall biosynthesis
MGPPVRVCLVMPFRNEAEHLSSVLASLRAQTYDPARVELIAIDDGSEDGGAALVEAWLRETGWNGRVIRAESRSIPSSLNRALAHVAPDAYVIRLDAHSLYAADYIATIMTAFDDLPADVWCVGGSADPTDSSRFGRALHAALFTNPMGLGNADYRREQMRPVSSVYLGAWRPGVLAKVGGYDTRWRANEDAELAERIREAGGIVVRVPARSYKIMTRGARAALVQWTRYGFWRAQTMVRHPRTLRFRHVAPTLAVLTAIALLASPARILFVPLYLAYAIATVACRPPGQRPIITLASLIYFPLVHAGYGCGILFGTLISLIAPRDDGARAAS